MIIYIGKVCYGREADLGGNPADFSYWLSPEETAAADDFRFTPSTGHRRSGFPLSGADRTLLRRRLRTGFDPTRTLHKSKLI